MANPKKELEGELGGALPRRFLRLKKVEQLEVIHLRSEQQEQIIRAEEGKVILEFQERVANPKKELEGELGEALPRNSLWQMESQSKKV